MVTESFGQQDALAGLVLAFGSALAWAIMYICVRIGTEEGSHTDAVLVTIFCNAALIAPPALIWYYPNYDITLMSGAAFLAGGVSGLFLGHVYQFKGIDIVGASRTAPVIASHTLIAALLAVAFLSETLTTFHLIGIVLIVGGIAVISYDSANSGGARKPSLRNLGYAALAAPLLSAFFFGFEPVFFSLGLGDGTSMFLGLSVATTVALVSYLGYSGWNGTLPSRRIVRSQHMKWYLGAGVANTAALVLYVAALEVAPVVLVIPIIQSAPLIVLVMSVLFLSTQLEQVTKPLVGASLVVVIGTVMVALSG